MLAIPDRCRERFISVSIQKKDLLDENILIYLNQEHEKPNRGVANVYLEILQTESDESVGSFRLRESLWRWSYMQSLCSSCTSRRAPSMPESFHSSPHMWRALIFNTINHRGVLGSWRGGLYSLDWAFDSAFRLVLRLGTMNSDGWIWRQCCEAGVNLNRSRTPASVFPSSSNYNNLRPFVQTHLPITPVNRCVPNICENRQTSYRRR